MQKICIDTGVLTLIVSNKELVQINQLQNNLKNGNLEGYVLKPALCEVYSHICKVAGKDQAQQKTMGLLRKLNLISIDLDDSLILEAGQLKCQHRSSLSYIDCMIIGFCLNNQIELHTTEKNIKRIPHNTLQKLKIVSYPFDSNFL